jgi:CHAT domain-containing protein
VGVSLWAIDDAATTEFMVRVYRKVIEGGMDFREAYYAVKEEFRRHPKWKHPRYWAAFTLYE